MYSANNVANYILCYYNRQDDWISNIQNAFPNNTVLAIPDNSCFEVFTKNTLISFLQDIIKQLEELK